MSQLVTISGCSGGGKTTLLQELKRRGFQTVEEPGRRIIAREERAKGDALPWKNSSAFAQRAIDMAKQDIALYPSPTAWVFFDRGLIDAASALSNLTNEPIVKYLTGIPRYHNTVFLTPPWPEIYVTDSQRRHNLAAAEEEYERLLKAFPETGYKIVVLERTSVEERADTILHTLNSPTHQP